MEKGNKPVIALTGATGFLGSHIMVALIENGYRVVILGRANKTQTLSERILQLLRWFGINEIPDTLEIVDVDFSSPMMGIPQKKYSELCSMTDQIFHCASDTNFSERKRDLVMATNVHSLAGILAYAADSHTKVFYYISTAYVAGIQDSVCMEALSNASRFVNVYEESKALAEHLIDSHCRDNSIPLAIIRPSVVFGDSMTGRTLKFNALYYPIKSLRHIRDIYLNDLGKNGGRKAQEQGVFIDSGGFLNMPLKIYLPQKGGINLIPVDYFVKAALKIIEANVSGGIFNLTNDTQTKPETIAAFSEDFMKLKGIEIVYGKPDANVLPNPAEELFNTFIEPYHYYFSDTRIFDRRNTDSITNGLQPPAFTEDIFRTCMDFAVRSEWGMKTL